MPTYNTSLAEFSHFVPEFARTLKGGEVIGLVGDLGAGKTTFTQLLGKELGITDRITSPTFVIMQMFKGVLPASQKPVILYHLDVYRPDSFSEVMQLGLSDFMGDANTITVIEWADKFAGELPSSTIYINLVS